LADCLFCRMIDKELNASVVYEDKYVFAINDINPQAPVHVLIMPKQHISSLDDATEQNLELLGHIQLRAREIARQLGLEGHFRLTTNCGEKAGQRVFHLHYHLLGGDLLDVGVGQGVK